MPIDFAQFNKKNSVIDTKKIEHPKNAVKVIKKKSHDKIINKKKYVSNSSYVGYGKSHMDKALRDTRMQKYSDNKLSSILNERLISVVKIGLKHELSIDNIIRYFKEVGKSKLYELKRYFSDSNSNEIEKILDFLKYNGMLTKDRNGWYGLK